MAKATEVKTKATESQQTEDAREYLELLMRLSEREKAQVKGIMVGMQLARQQAAVQTA